MPRVHPARRPEGEREPEAVVAHWSVVPAGRL